MHRSRVTRMIALLVLILAQAALVLPHRMMAETVTASDRASGSAAHEDCHGTMAGQAGGEAGQRSHSRGQMPPCGSCPVPMPGTTCVQMVSCGPSSASPAALSATLLPTVASTDFAPAISSPAAHDFIPDPPPPRA